MHCTQCGTEGAGAFCGSCGASLRPIACPSCETEMEKGLRFCTECGGPLRLTSPVSSPSPAAGTLPWALTGVLLVALLVGAAFPIFSSEGGGGQPAGGPQAMAPGQLGPAPNVDLSSMTPREAADRLFERVAIAISAQDSVEVRNFLPMALDAYDLARPLDPDGHFHLALLQRVSLEFERSLETALAGLEQDPDHLLLLSAAAEAHLEMGEEEPAREYYGRMLAVWDEQMERDLDDYDHHVNLMPIIRQDAEALLGEG